MKIESIGEKVIVIEGNSSDCYAFPISGVVKHKNMIYKYINPKLSHTSLSWNDRYGVDRYLNYYKPKEGDSTKIETCPIYSNRTLLSSGLHLKSNPKHYITDSGGNMYIHTLCIPDIQELLIYIENESFQEITKAAFRD